MAEGQVWEAAEFAGHYKLDNLTRARRRQRARPKQPTMYQHDMEIYRKKFESEGFATEVIDGHDVAAVLAALIAPRPPRAARKRSSPAPSKATASISSPAKNTGTARRFRRTSWPRPCKEIGPAVDVPPDPGKSYARASLPQPPDFPAPAAPDYADGKPVADARSLWLCPEAPRRRESADRGDFRRREKFHVLRDFPKRVSRPFLPGLHCRAEHGKRGRGARRASARCRSSTRSLASCRAPMTKSAWPPSAAAISICAARIAASPSAKTAPRRWLSRTSPCSARCTARRFFIRATRFPPNASRKRWRAARHQLPAHVASEDSDPLLQGRKVPGAGIQGAAPERAG